MADRSDSIRNLQYGPQLPPANQRRVGKAAPIAPMHGSSLTPEQEREYDRREKLRRAEMKARTGSPEPKWIYGPDGVTEVRNPAWFDPNPEPPAKVPQITSPPKRRDVGADSKKREQERSQERKLGPDLPDPRKANARDLDQDVIPKNTRKLPPPPNAQPLRAGDKIIQNGRPVSEEQPVPEQPKSSSRGIDKFERQLLDQMIRRPGQPKQETPIRFPGRQPAQSKPAPSKPAPPRASVTPPPASPPPPPPAESTRAAPNTMREVVRGYYGDNADAEIRAATQARMNRPSNVDMSKYDAFPESRYDDPMNPQMTMQPKERMAEFKPADGSINMNSRYFPQGASTPRSQRPGWDEVLAHEGTHKLGAGSSNLPIDQDSSGDYSTAPSTVTRRTEIDTNAAEIRRLFTQHTGVPVRSHEDALDALYWYMGNYGKLRESGERPVATPEAATQYMRLPEQERMQVLQRMLEVAGSDRLRGSLMS